MEKKEMQNQSASAESAPESPKLEKTMADVDDQSDEIMDPEISSATTTRRKRGGLITIPFIIANEGFERVASFGLLPNMILYLMRGYNLSFAKGNYILFLWSAATNFTPTIGAFLADSYLGRFLTIALGCFFSLLGMILLWLTAMLPKAKPPSCNLMPPCESATPAQFGLLISSFSIMSIGAGGIRASSMAFGADQLDNKDNPNNERVLESYFGWYYAATLIGVLIAITGIVYIQDHMGWKLGFGVPVILMFAASLLFVLASPFYIKQEATTSLFTGFAHVIAAAHRNKKLAFPPPDSVRYHHEKGSRYTVPTDRLRFLNKACIIWNPEDVAPSGIAANPWNLCTVQQVEELKTLIRVIPIWSTGIMMSINTSQSSFPLLQATTMNRHVTSSFQIPAGSFGLFLIITLTVWVILYDRAILPFASKIRGKPVRLSPKLRMGIGLFFTAMAMVVSGIVEHVRLRKAIEQGLINNPQALVGMSAMWLVPQNCLAGLAEAFNAIGQVEFYYTEFPKTMSSIAASLFGLGMGVANLLATLILSTVDRYTKGEGKESWVSTNINKGRYENYYWLLAIMSFVNLLYYMLCSWLYGPSSAHQVLQNLDENGGKEKGLDIEPSLIPESPARVVPAA